MTQATLDQIINACHQSATGSEFGAGLLFALGVATGVLLILAAIKVWHIVE